MTAEYSHWLYHQYIEDVESSISASEVAEEFCQKFENASRQCIGNYIKKTFPQAKVIKLRESGNWNKRYYVYKGIAKRTEKLETVFFQNISEYIPSDFFVLRKLASCITIGKDTGLLCNANKVFTEVSINHDGLMDISVGGTRVENILSSEKILFNTHFIKSLFSTLKILRFCEGLQSKFLAGDKKENAIIQRNAQNTLVCYSVNCLKVLPLKFRETTRTCIPRKNLSRVKSRTLTAETNNTGQGVPPPSVVNTATSTHYSPEQIADFLQVNAPYLSAGQVDLIKSQLKNSHVNNIHSRKWDPNIIQLALSIWTRSPRAYEQLAKSGTVILPSEVTLSRYKNSVEQKAGINNDMLQWRFMQAQHDHLSPEGFYGGLILDEMAIQEDIQISQRGGTSKLVGFSNLGPEAENMSTGETRTKLANHVLQFMFHGLTNFRFLVAHYPTVQANGPQIYSVFWDVVQALETWGFHVIYTCLDGASNNRSFIKMHFQEPSLDMSVLNPFNDQFPLVFIADPSHLVKKIRNNILKSGTDKYHTRLLTINNSEITWKLFIAAYKWDKTHGLSIHHKLTHQHIYPNPAEKMRNHLAEECLNKDMLHLFRKFRDSQSHPDNAAKYDGVIKLLEKTSVIIDFF